MDEIKNTAEAEEQKVNAAEAASVENNVENAANAAETQETENTENAKQANPTTKAEVIERLKEIVYNGGNVERTELDHLKMLSQRRCCGCTRQIYRRRWQTRRLYACTRHRRREL